MRIAAWLSVLAGIWLVLSSFVLGFSSNISALWNNVISGIVIIILGLILTSSHKPTPPTQ